MTEMVLFLWITSTGVFHPHNSKGDKTMKNNIINSDDQRLTEYEKNCVEHATAWWGIQQDYISEYVASIASTQSIPHIENFFLSVTTSLQEQDFSRDDIEEFLQCSLDSCFGSSDDISML